MRAARRPRGFTYLMLLWWVALSGVMLAAIGHQWAFESRRQREMEMVFRANQIRMAIESYRQSPAPGQPPSWPKRLNDLLEDRRGGVLKRHLRQAWPDPLMGQTEWGLIQDGATPQAGITGVFSLAPGQPLRAPPGVTRYDQWQFDAAPAPPPAPKS